MNRDTSISTPHLEEALFSAETKRHINAEIGSRLLDIDRSNEFRITMQIAPIHYHPLLNPLCLSGFTLIPDSDEWLTDRGLLVVFMLWKMNKA